MIINEARSVDLRNQRLGDDKAETLHGCGHGSSVAAIIEPQNNMGGGVHFHPSQCKSEVDAREEVREH